MGYKTGLHSVSSRLHSLLNIAEPPVLFREGNRPLQHTKKDAL